MNEEIINIINTANEFLKIPSSISYEKPFLDYLNNNISKLGYKTHQTKKYLTIKPKDKTAKPKHLFSIHIDRHSIIQNDEKEIEYLGFYLKKQEGITFKRENIQKDENEIVSQLQKDGYTSILTDKHIKIEKNKHKLRFIREGGEDFFEKVALRYIGVQAYSYRPETGRILNQFKIERYNINHKIPLVTYLLNPKPRENDKIFSLISQIKIYDNIFYGQIDNVISAATIYHLLESTNFQDEIIFTTEEEIGKSWQHITKYLKKEKEKIELISLDTTPYENFNELKDGSIILRRGDENGEFSKELLDKIEKIIIKKSIPKKFKAPDIGLTELGRIIQHTNGKFNGATIQLPSMNYHTTYETSTLSSLENYLKIIKELSKK